MNCRLSLVRHRLDSLVRFLSIILGIVEATSDDLSGSQLQLHIDLVRAKIDHHDVPGTAWWFAQLDDLNLVAALQP